MMALGVGTPSTEQRQTAHKHTSARASPHPFTQHTLRAEISIRLDGAMQCLHRRDTLLGRLGRGRGHGTGNSGWGGDTLPSPNTPQQVPEIRRKSEEKG